MFYKIKLSNSPEYCFTAKSCKNGDVRLRDGGKPRVYWNNNWVPICGHYFWDNAHGATLFCKKMGYETGTVSDTGKRYSQDSLRIGKCNIGDALESCKGGCNDYKVGKSCKNNDSVKCGKGERVGISIKCQGDSRKTSSCKDTEGNRLLVTIGSRYILYNIVRIHRFNLCK